jgi:hypothetical protein
LGIAAVRNEGHHNQIEKNKMEKLVKVTVLVLLILFASHRFAQAQTAPTTTSTPAAGSQNRVLGEVLAIDSNTGQLSLKTAQGAQVIIKCDEKTLYRRVPAGEKSLDKAVAINLTDIGAGDRVIARGSMTDGSNALVAGVVIVVDDKDIAQKKERDRAEWLKRGIEGVVTAANPETNEVSLLTHSSEGAKSFVITTGSSRVRRYAPDSIKYSDAVPSSIKEVKVGDRLRALGDKSSDGTHFTAEEIVFGSIRTIGGFITAIDPTRGEIQINDIPTKQLLTVVINNDSVLRRLSPEVVKQLGAVPAGNSAVDVSPRARSAELQQLIEKQPAETLADLKVGDAILASSTVGATPSQVRAIIVATGVESFLKQYIQQPKGRDFNLSLGLPSGIGP